MGERVQHRSSLFTRLQVKPFAQQHPHVRFHTTAQVNQCFPLASVGQGFLPKYIPQLNPTEHVFAWVKSKIRRYQPHPETTAQLETAIEHVLQELNHINLIPYYSDTLDWRARALASETF